MCESCNPRHTLTRRTFLGAAAAAVGALTALSCREEPKKSEPTSTPSTQSSVLSTQHFAPVPDLGSEIFPDALGRPIADPKSAPVIIIPRSNWTAIRPNLNEIAVMNGIHHITVHHTAWQLDSDAWKPTATELDHILDFHAGTQPRDRHWADIAYHFVVDRAGRVWQARPLAYQGAHVKSHNPHNLGIVLLGNFNTQSPAAAQLTALTLFIPFLRKLYDVPVTQIFTHGELGQTSCPGQRLQSFMNRTRKKWAAAENLANFTLPTSQPATTQSTSP